MSTISKTILPIPESVVVGSGSYTVPANKYGYFQAFTALTLAADVQISSTGDCANSTAATSDSAQWVVAGVTISASATTVTDPSLTSGTAYVNSDSQNSVSLNGQAVVGCYIRTFAQRSSTGTYSPLIRSASLSGWSVSLFPIPKNNLPASLIEG